MRFSFSGRHMEIGESLLSRARESCEVLAKKYGIEFIDVSIVMKKDNYLFHSDISIKGGCGNSYMANNEADDPIVSFEGLLHKIDMQIRKKKTCKSSCSRRVTEINNFDNSFNSSDHVASSGVIVAEILDDLPLYSVSEAAAHLSDKCQVVIFENVANNAVNVVYRREDGNTGWIDYKTKNHM